MASHSVDVAYDGCASTARLLEAQPDDRLDRLNAGRTAVQYMVRHAGSCLSVLADDDSTLFTQSVTHFWTPHSAQNFLPCAASALDIPNTDKDYLGGWVAKGSDLYAEVCRLKVSNIQRAVVRTMQDSAPGDSSGERERERETLARLRSYIGRQSAPDRSMRDSLKRLRKWKTADLALPRPEPRESQTLIDIALEKPLDDYEMTQNGEDSSKRKICTSPRSKLRSVPLGNNLKQQRRQFRASLAPRLYVSMIPNADDPQFSYIGTWMPPPADFDAVCKGCAAKRLRHVILNG